MRMILFSHPVLVICGEIGRRRIQQSLTLRTDAMHVPEARKYLSESTSAKHKEESDRLLNAMELRDDVPTEELMDSPLSRFISFAANSCGYSGTTKELIVNRVHPLFLKAKAEASKAYHPNWWEPMKSLFANEYWKATVKEIETLEKMGCWDVVDCPAGAHVIHSTWAFMIKQYSDCLIKKFKASFCIRGDQQVHGVDFFETYSPVVQSTTIWLILILEYCLVLSPSRVVLRLHLFMLM